MEDSTKEPVNLAPSVKRKGVATRSWLVVSKSGESRIEEVGKHFVRRRTGIPARDLRILDPALSYPATILGRERAIVVNLEHIKAIVTATEMLVLNPKDPGVVPFVQDLECGLSSTLHNNSLNNTLTMHREFSHVKGTDRSNEKEIEGSPSTVAPPEARDKSPVFSKNTTKVVASKAPVLLLLPFEFRVLEICLEFVCKCFDAETSIMEQEAYPALDELSVSVSTLNLQRVRAMKSRLAALTGRVQKLRDELEHLLDDDTDMKEMYLTDKLISSGQNVEGEPKDDETVELNEAGDEIARSTRSSNAILSDQKPKIEELEMLLEAYFVQLDGALNKLSTIREYVDDTEDYINIVLDDKQNQLLKMTVVIGIGIVVNNIGIVCTGLLGMNINIPILISGTSTQYWQCTAGIVSGLIFLFVVAILSIKWKGLI